MRTVDTKGASSPPLGAVGRVMVPMVSRVAMISSVSMISSVAMMTIVMAVVVAMSVVVVRMSNLVWCRCRERWNVVWALL